LGFPANGLGQVLWQPALKFPPFAKIEKNARSVSGDVGSMSTPPLPLNLFSIGSANFSTLSPNQNFGQKMCRANSSVKGTFFF